MDDVTYIGFDEFTPEETERWIKMGVIEVRFDDQGETSYHLTPQAVRSFDENLTRHIKEAQQFEN
jgi:lipopolysaccharide export system protein LptC